SDEPLRLAMERALPQLFPLFRRRVVLLAQLLDRRHDPGWRRGDERGQTQDGRVALGERAQRAVAAHEVHARAALVLLVVEDDHDADLRRVARVRPAARLEVESFGFHRRIASPASAAGRSPSDSASARGTTRTLTGRAAHTISFVRRSARRTAASFTS